VLFDAVAVVTSEDGAAELASMPAARDFLSDALAHFKFIGFVEAARPLFDRIRAEAGADRGQIALHGRESATRFVQSCRAHRFWDRTP
jgi:catalase